MKRALTALADLRPGVYVARPYVCTTPQCATATRRLSRQQFTAFQETGAVPCGCRPGAVMRPVPHPAYGDMPVSHERTNQ